MILVQTSGPHHIWKIQNLASGTWLLGGLGSLVAGLVADSNRLTAFLAVMFTVFTFVARGTQFLV